MHVHKRIAKCIENLQLDLKALHLCKGRLLFSFIHGLKWKTLHFEPLVFFIFFKPICVLGLVALYSEICFSFTIVTTPHAFVCYSFYDCLSLCFSLLYVSVLSMTFHFFVCLDQTVFWWKTHGWFWYLQFIRVFKKAIWVHRRGYNCFTKLGSGGCLIWCAF